jgi:hypothetical protein
MAKKSSNRPVVIASTEEASQFIQALQAFMRKNFPGSRGSKAKDKAMREYLAQFDAEKQRSVLRRALINLIQHPTVAKRPRGSGNSARLRPARSARTRR